MENDIKTIYEKKTGTQEMYLSDYLQLRNFKIEEFNTDLDLSSLEYEGLTDYLEERLKETVKDNKNVSEFNLKAVNYSLNYCQGDGVCFECTLKYKGQEIKVKHSGHYYHENSKEINIFNEEDLSEEEINSLYDEFNSVYIELCKDLEKLGYSYIESDNDYELRRLNLKEFFDKNNLLELNEYDYELSKEEERNEDIKYVEVFEGYYMQDFKLIVEKYTQTKIIEFEKVKVD